MQPESGVRFELRLLTAEGGSAAYAVELGLPGSVFTGRATIEPESGRVAFDWQAAPPSWSENVVRAQLRTLYRERSAGYPRRVTRWRPAPAEGPA